MGEVCDVMWRRKRGTLAKFAGEVRSQDQEMDEVGGETQG